MKKLTALSMVFLVLFSTFLMFTPQAKATQAWFCPDVTIHTLIDDDGDGYYEKHELWEGEYGNGEFCFNAYTDTGTLTVYMKVYGRVDGTEYFILKTDPFVINPESCGGAYHETFVASITGYWDFKLELYDINNNLLDVLDYGEEPSLTDVPMEHELGLEDFDDVSDWSLKGKGGVDSGQYGLSSGADLWVVCNDAGNEYVTFKIHGWGAIDPNKHPSLAVSFFTSPNTMFKVHVEDLAGNVKLILSVTNQLVWTTRTVNLKSYTTNLITAIWLTVDDYPDSTASGEAHAFIRSIIASGYGWQEPFSNVARWKLGSAYGTTSYGLSSDGYVAKLWLKADDGGNEYVGYKTAVSIDPLYYPYLNVRFKTSSNCLFKIRIKDSVGNVYSILSASSSAWAVRTIDLGSYTWNTITEVWIYADDSPNSYAGGTIYANIDYMNAYGYWDYAPEYLNEAYVRFYSTPPQSSGGVVSGEWGLETAGDFWVRCNDIGNEYAGYRRKVSIDPNTYPYLGLRFRTTPNALLEIRIKDSAGIVKLILSTSSLKWAIQKINLKGFTTKIITEISVYVNDKPDSTATGQINAIIDCIHVHPS